MVATKSSTKVWAVSLPPIDADNDALIDVGGDAFVSLKSTNSKPRWMTIVVSHEIY